MATTKLKGNPVQTCGDIPIAGDRAPDAVLTVGDLADVKISGFLGSNLVLNIFPSVDTGVCAASVRRFNEAAAALKNAKILCISRDLPFAQQRFCGAEGIADVVMLSEMRGQSFGGAYGVCIVDGPLAGLFARAVVVIDATGKVAYSQLVPEIAEEPNYDAALKCLKTLSGAQ
jgi:thioredoxin-dependent peroxiredoxin